jgi:uncharacterized protein
MLRTSLIPFAFFFAFLGLASTQNTMAADPPRGKANSLATQSSPYLLQHAHNPVDWRPWGPEAFAEAKKAGKLVFLSIGYSACHWCHVMEKESFANEAIAKILNENFVCVKVDREERPDVDDVYMAALEVTGIGGGWPLTMFLTPEGKPIFGGTYFPPDDQKVGDATRPGMKSMLKKVIELHRDKRQMLFEQADRIAELTKAQTTQAAGGLAIKWDAQLVADATAAFELDPEHGGLSRLASGYRGTKFPRVAALQFLLKQSTKPGNEALAKLMTLSLERMARGGIYDHLGGGFHRYSTERTWTVPHFEKMLYDQAQLVELYTQAYQIAPNPEYKRVIQETLEFVARELTAPEGYFYSALDADSDGEEGRFYVWTPKELDTVLGSGPDQAVFRTVYDLRGKPNFEEKYHILRIPKPLAEIAAEQKSSVEGVLDVIAPLKARLFEIRGKRNRPFRDTKCITAWNGQMIAAYALAGQVLKEPKYLAAAEKAAEFVRNTLHDRGGQLLRIYAVAPGGKPLAQGAAFLDDYAFLIHGLLNLHDAGAKAKNWQAIAWEEQQQVNRRYDDIRGGFFTTPHDGDRLFARGKIYYDGAQPSANGITALNLIRMNKPEDQKRNILLAVRTIHSAGAMLKIQPTAVPLMADALDRLLAAKVAIDSTDDATVAEKPDPKSSASQVTVKLRAEGQAEGQQTYSVDLYIADGWHIYANPVNNKDLVASVTEVQIFVGEKMLKNLEIRYPNGKLHKDSSGAEYQIYESKASVVFRFSAAETGTAPVTARVKVIACDDKNCLKPATIRAEVK